MSRERSAAFLNKGDAPRGTLEKLDTFVELLREEARRQNLIAASTLDSIWERHILDSLQLLPLSPPAATSWIDIGSGAGLPGLVIAASGLHNVTLVEPRRRRVEFLARCIDTLGLRNAAIFAGKAERMGTPGDVISARAVAPLDTLFEISLGLSHSGTRLIFPKGRSARTELEAARASWQGEFHIEASLTDPSAAIVVADHVERRAGS